jgi:hypothetical protein
MLVRFLEKFIIIVETAARPIMLMTRPIRSSIKLKPRPQRIDLEPVAMGFLIASSG